MTLAALSISPDAWLSTITALGLVLLSALGWLAKRALHSTIHEMAQVATKELTHNGGSSMKDATGRIEAKVDKLADRLEMKVDQLAESLVLVRERVAAVETTATATKHDGMTCCHARNDIP